MGEQDDESTAEVPPPPSTAVVEIEEKIRSVRSYGGEIAAAGLEPDPLWDSTLDSARLELAEKPTVEIALLGGTGAGKSTLVNALAECRLLPVSSMRACTSAITELSYQPNLYTATVEFVSRESWLKELQHLEQDLADQELKTGDEVARAISSAAESKLDAVYGGDVKARYLTSLDHAELIEPVEIEKAFDAGSISFSSADDGEFRDRVKQYLDSGERYWPIVKRVSVKGPFRRIEDGMVLVDLPGLNDPNPAREEATRHHLKSARFVWVVFNMKRALTKDVFEFLREGDLLRRLFVDGHTGSLTLIGTGSDEIDFDSDIENFDLPEDSSALDVVRARSKAVCHVVGEQLDELAMLLGHDAEATPVQVEDLRNQLQAATIHTVSAREYMKCRGLMRKTNQVVAVESETGVPGLQDDAAALVGQFGEAAHYEQIDQSVESVRLSMLNFVDAQAGAIATASSASADQLKEVERAADRLRRFLDESTKEAQSSLLTDVRSKLDGLEEQLAKHSSGSDDAVKKMRRELRSVHWSTMRAAARRSGVFASPTYGKVDLVKMVSKPFLDATSFQWVDVFGKGVKEDVRLFGDKLRASNSNHSSEFIDACRGVSESLVEVVDFHLSPATKTQAQIVDDRVALLIKSIDERLTQDRKVLDSAVESAVGNRLKAAFERAAVERGKGTRDRMVDGIVSSAEKVLTSALHDACKTVHRSLNELATYVDVESQQTRRLLTTEAAQVRDLVTSAASAELDEEELRQAEAALEALRASAPMPTESVEVPRSSYFSL